jgi:hypothetical protein
LQQLTVGEELLVEYLFALLQDRKLLAACVRELGMQPPSNSTGTAAATASTASADATATAGAGVATKAVSNSSRSSVNKQWVRELTPEDILVGAERACGGSGESSILLSESFYPNPSE